MNRFTPVLLDEAIAEARGQRVQPDEPARLRVRIHLGYRACDRSRDGVGNLVGALTRTKGPRHWRTGFARHDLNEFGFGRNRKNHGYVNVRARQFGPKAFG